MPRSMPPPPCELQVEKFDLVAVPTSAYGSFYTGEHKAPLNKTASL